MRILKVVLLSLIITMIGGCGDSNLSDASNVKSNIDYQEEEKKQEERSNQTLWTVLDEDGNDKSGLENTNENVKEIIDIIEKHCSIIDNRDFNELNVEDEYSLYNEGFNKVLEKGNYKNSVESMYKNNKLVLNHENLIWYRNYFNEDMTTCKVTVESEFTIKEGNKDYLEKNQMSLDKVYQEKRVYYMEKEENNWSIVNIEKGALTKRN